MSAHNWWEFGKKGAKWGAVLGAAVMVAGALLAPGIGLGIGALAVTALSGAAQGAFFGGLGGSIIGAFTSNKPKEQLVDVQTPNGRVISVSAQDLERAQEQESSRFRDMVEQSRGGARVR